MNIYIAAPLAEAYAAREWASCLRDYGFTVTSTWHDVVEDGEPEPGAEHMRAEILTVNLRDLEAADVLFAVMRTGVPRATYAEIGWALRAEKRVVFLHGARVVNTCLFDAHPLSYSTHSTTDALRWLQRLASVAPEAAE